MALSDFSFVKKIELFMKTQYFQVNAPNVNFKN